MFRSAATAAPQPEIASGTMPGAPTAVLRRLEWRVRHAVNTSLTGDYRSAFRGRGMEFDQVVKYQWGDDLRDIDWNVTARLGEPYRKKFVEERELSLIFLFEDTPALRFGSGSRTRRDTLLEMAALLMLVGATNRDRVGLMYHSPVTSWYQRPQAGHKGVMRTASRLLNQPPPPLDGPSQCEALPWQFMRRIASKGSVLLWFGAFTPAAQPEGWRALQQRYQTVGIRADDAWDMQLPERAQFTAYDPLAQRMMSLNTSASAERAAHAQWRERREAYFSELFPQIDDRLPVGNGDDTLQATVAYFHRHRHHGATAR
jgi:uncharacterized protein (DUF58 family)